MEKIHQAVRLTAAVPLQKRAAMVFADRARIPPLVLQIAADPHHVRQIATTATPAFHGRVITPHAVRDANSLAAGAQPAVKCHRVRPTAIILPRVAMPAITPRVQTAVRMAVADAQAAV